MHHNFWGWCVHPFGILVEASVAKEYNMFLVCPRTCCIPFGMAAMGLTKANAHIPTNSNKQEFFKFITGRPTACQAPHLSFANSRTIHRCISPGITPASYVQVASFCPVRIDCFGPCVLQTKDHPSAGPPAPGTRRTRIDSQDTAGSQPQMSSATSVNLSF